MFGYYSSVAYGATFPHKGRLLKSLPLTIAGVFVFTLGIAVYYLSVAESFASVSLPLEGKVAP